VPGVTSVAEEHEGHEKERDKEDEKQDNDGYKQSDWQRHFLSTSTQERRGVQHLYHHAKNTTKVHSIHLHNTRTCILLFILYIIYYLLLYIIFFVKHPWVYSSQGLKAKKLKSKLEWLGPERRQSRKCRAVEQSWNVAATERHRQTLEQKWRRSLLTRETAELVTEITQELQSWQGEAPRLYYYFFRPTSTKPQAEILQRNNIIIIIR